MKTLRRLPRGSSSGKKRRANDSLTRMTWRDSAFSASVNRRPRFKGIPIALKYSESATRTLVLGPVPRGGAGRPSTLKPVAAPSPP